MNGSVFWRLVWKEYRMQRSFWIAMAVLTLLVQLLVLALVRAGPDRVTWLFTLGLGLPAFYALGCGATLFATEHEAGTYEFQRSLPVSAMRLFGGKVAFAVVSILAMIGLLWPLSVILAGWQLPRPEDHLELWGLWGLAAVELLLWGMFFSLLCPRPLLAAILGVTAASVSVHVVAGGPAPSMGGEPYLGAAPLRAAIAGLVALADIWLGYRWFGERIVAYGGAARLRRRRAVGEEISVVSGGGPPPRRAILGRLLWHHWRQSVGTMAALSAMLVPVVSLFAWYTIRERIDLQGPHLFEPVFDPDVGVPIFVAVALAAAPLMGACVFLADQRGHTFRFLTEHGLGPGQVWLSRQLVWASAVLLCTGAVAALATSADARAGPGEVLVGLGYLLAFVVLAYASGQIWSMFLRSGILAGFLSLVLTGALCGWAWLMGFLGISWLWSVAPIPLVLLLATWLRAPGWLLERNTLRAWLRPGLALVVPAAALLTAVPLYRINQIPAVDPGFSPEEFARPATAEEKATFEMYRRASLMYVPMSGRKLPSDTDEETAPPEPEAERTAREKAWIEANAEVIALTLEASRRPACDFFDPQSDPSKALVLHRCRFLCDLLVASAGQLQSEGKLDAALERYLAALRVSLHLRHRAGWLGPDLADHGEASVYDHLPTWAAHPDQTPQRIVAAIGQLGKLTQNAPSRSEAIKSDYLWTRRLIAGDPVAWAQEVDARRRREFWATLAMQRLPWERARARRVLNLLTARELKSFSDVEFAMSREASFTLADSAGDEEEWLALMRSTPLLAPLDSLRRWAYIPDLASVTKRRRTVCLVLALRAWKIEHGELPKTLDELVGPYLERLPVDPYTAEPFRYFPNRVPVPLEEWAPNWPLLLP